tara:strand:+ start:78 stop:341 length:264 start_codon:yes stop_codon:yes gene_type:complete
MPGIARNGVDAAGGIAIQGSSNVNVNGSGAVRIDDKVASHGLAPHSPTPPMVDGSTTVFANGIGVCRSGDAASCGHTISGSSNVNAG